MCGGRSLSQELRPSVLDRAASVACADHPSRLRARCRSRRVEFAYVPLRAQLAAPCITAPTQREPTRRSLERAPPSRERVVGLDRAASVACADHPSRFARAAVAAASSAPTSLRVPSSLLFLASPRQLNKSRHDDRQSERCRAESEPSVLIAPPPWRAPIIRRAPRALP